jgi:release factor glutamine methyltransferase
VEQVENYFHYLNRLSRSWTGLPDKPHETPDTTLRSLWLLAKGDPRSIENSIFAELPLLRNEEFERLDHYIEMRLSNTPLAHLTGRQYFMGIEMLVGPEALIPRKETEILGQAALARLRQIVRERGSATVIDLCTGCGNLALALAFHEPDCVVYGSDISEEAIELAQNNARHLDLEDRVNFLVGDLFIPFESDEFFGNVDLLVCNPPYISTVRVDEMADEISKHEPYKAFDGGAFGVSVLLSLIKDGPNYLKPRSWLGFEVGLAQGEAMRRQVERNGAFETVQVHCDEQDQIRAIFGLSTED